MASRSPRGQWVKLIKCVWSSFVICTLRSRYWTSNYFLIFIIIFRKDISLLLAGFSGHDSVDGGWFLPIGPLMRGFDISLIARMNRQLGCQRLEMPWCSYNVTLARRLRRIYECTCWPSVICENVFITILPYFYLLVFISCIVILIYMLHLSPNKLFNVIVF